MNMSKLKSKKWLIICAFTFGLAILTRPILPAVIMAIFALFLLTKPDKISSGKIVMVSLAMFFALIIIIFIPWSLRNKLAFGFYSFSNVSTNVVLYFRIYPIAIAAERGITYHEAIKVISDELPNKIEGWNEPTSSHTFAYTEFYKQEAMAKVRKYWPQIFKYYLSEYLPAGVFLTGYNELFDIFWPEWRTPDPDLTTMLEGRKFKDFIVGVFANKFQPILVFGSLMWAVIYAVIIWGLIKNWRKKQDMRTLMFFVVFALFFMAISVAPPLFVRYKMIASPFLFILFGYSIQFIKLNIKL